MGIANPDGSVNAVCLRDVSDLFALTILDWGDLVDHWVRENKYDDKRLLDGPDGVSKFFDTQWNQILPCQFLHCKTDDGWYVVYRGDRGQSDRIPIEEFVNAWFWWQSIGLSYGFEELSLADLRFLRANIKVPYGDRYPLTNCCQSARMSV